MHTIHINEAQCKKDGICVAECPAALFLESPDGVPVLAEGAGELCINCGHCIAVCPGAAISVNGISAEHCDRVDRQLAISQAQVTQLFRSRRSIRCYKPKPVERPVLENLLELTRWAPTAKNGQPIHWIVIRNADEVAVLAKMIIDWMRQENMLPGIVQAFENGKDIVLRHAPGLLIAHASSQAIKPVEDCSIALATLEAAAPVFGLGACWAGYFMSAAQMHDPIREFLALPADHRIYGALMLGYPQYAYHRIPPRQPLKIQWR